MKRSMGWVAAGALALFGTFVGIEGTARADLSSCGNIDVQANAQCQLVASGGCTAKCTPITFEAACAAKLEATCDGSCTANVEASCSASCEGDCEAKCNVDPPKFDCEGTCEGSCDGDCSAKCSGKGQASGGSADAEGQCNASCKACCHGHCSGKCTAKPGTADCKATCMGSCQGSCEGKANAQCQIDCQAKGYVDCQAQLMGGCMAQCSQPKGALFCDGQYVDTGNNLQNCLDALKAELNIQVMGEVDGGCSGNTCSGAAAGSISAKGCAVAEPGDGPLAGGFLFAGLGALGAAIIRRKRAKRV